MDKTEKFFYLPQATNASFVLSPSDGPACTPEPLEPEPPPESEGPAGSYPCPCCGCLTFPVPKEEAIAYICPVCFWENDVFDPDEDAPAAGPGKLPEMGGRAGGSRPPCPAAPARRTAPVNP